MGLVLLKHEKGNTLLIVICYWELNIRGDPQRLQELMGYEAMRDFARLVAAGEQPQRTIAPLQLSADAWYRDPQGNFDRLFQQWGRHL